MIGRSLYRIWMAPDTACLRLKVQLASCALNRRLHILLTNRALRSNSFKGKRPKILMTSSIGRNSREGGFIQSSFWPSTLPSEVDVVSTGMTVNCDVTLILWFLSLLE